MERKRQLEITEGVVEATTNVLAMGFDTLILKPEGDFEITDHTGLGAFGNLNRIADVITVTVRDQNEVCFYIFRCGCGGGVIGEEWIDENFFVINF
jgi:hypothetical protein